MVYDNVDGLTIIAVVLGVDFSFQSVGYVVMTWEWLTFMAIQILFGKVWKTPPRAPTFLSILMKNSEWFRYRVALECTSHVYLQCTCM